MANAGLFSTPEQVIALKTLIQPLEQPLWAQGEPLVVLSVED